MLERRLESAYFPPETSAEAASSNEPREKMVLSRDSDIEFIKSTMESIKTFVESGNEEFELPNVNSFLIRALREEIAEQYPNLEIEKRTEPSIARFLLNIPAEKLKERREAQRVVDMEHFKKRCGFRRAWKVITASKKPICLHNGGLDLLFLWNALEEPLPSLWTEYKQQVSAAFPEIYDTKCIALGLEQVDVERTGVGDLVEYLKGREDIKVDFTLAKGFEKYSDTSELYHEAAYDAMETGRIYGLFESAYAFDFCFRFFNIRISRVNVAVIALHTSKLRQFYFCRSIVCSGNTGLQDC